MIQRFAGAVPTRSRAVVHDGLVFTVATAAVKSPSVYEQTKQTLATIDRNLADAGSSKSRILSATVYITDMAHKPEMDRAWGEWLDPANPPQRACLGVALEGDTLVEIVVTAAAG
jgi:enamine deaminase RidA (YjgF/YER057c/UK114 family)